MRVSTIAAALLLSCTLCFVGGQRITTIQLDGVQYFVSRLNPYSPALNYFLAYQYCRSLGLQLASFETKEKADSITQYLTNAGYSDHDFWTSGNRLGRDMFLWMSTGLPFNVTFNYMRESNDDAPPTLIGSGPVGEPSEEEALQQEPEQEEGKSRGRQLVSKEGSCVMLSAPDLKWDVDDCHAVKDFICEQTRCYYYNYGSIPVSASQGSYKRPFVAPRTTPPTTAAPITTTAPPREPEEDYTTTTTTTTTTHQPPSFPSFKVNRRITLRPLHFPNLGSLLASPWSSSLAPSPVYHHGKRSKEGTNAHSAPAQEELSTTNNADEATTRPEVYETTPMQQADKMSTHPVFSKSRKETVDSYDIDLKLEDVK